MTRAVVVHQLPARMRLRIDGHRGDEDFFDRIGEAILKIEGVAAVKPNPRTGSIVIHFGGGPDSLLSRIREQGFEIAFQQDATQAGRAAGMNAIRTMTAGKISPMFVAGVALAALGVVQTVRGKIAVPSITAFWYALDAFRASAREK